MKEGKVLRQRQIFSFVSINRNLQNQYSKSETWKPHSFLIRHGGLSHWGRSNRSRIRPGTVKSLNAPWDLSWLLVSPPTRQCQENWPLSYVSLVRATYCTIGSGQYTMLSGRPVQTGQVLFEFKFTTGIVPWLVFNIYHYLTLFRLKLFVNKEILI